MSKQKTATKKSIPKKSPVKRNKISFEISSDNICGQLNDWAHAGTEESLNKLEDFMVTEKNKDLREYARIAYDEANYFYYAPNNDKEEREFILARLISEREEYFWKLMSEADGLKEKIREFEIKKSVHNRLMKKKLPKNILDDWKYNCSDDFIVWERNRLYEIGQEIKYDSTWLSEAKKMITLKKYQNIPADVFAHIHFAGDVGHHVGQGRLAAGFFSFQLPKILNHYVFAFGKLVSSEFSVS